MPEEQEIKDNNDWETEEDQINKNTELTLKRIVEWLKSQDKKVVLNLEKLGKLSDVSKLLKYTNWFESKDKNGITGYDKIQTLTKIKSYNFDQSLNNFKQKENKYDKQFQEKLDSLEENFKDKFDMLDEKFQEVENLADNYSVTLQQGFKVAQKITDTFEQNDEILKDKQGAWNDFQDDCETTLKGFETDHSSILDKTRLELEKLKKELKEIKDDALDILDIATSAGLSKSYGKKIDDISKEINWQKNIFIAVNLLMTIIASIFFIISTLNPSNDIVSFVIRFLPTLALIAPLIWIAKQNGELLRQNLHIREEYEHKRSLVATYSGYRKTLFEMLTKDDSSKPIINLIESTTQGIMRNPSEQLPKSKQELMPFEVICRYLVKLPKNQFDKITSLADKVISVIVEKINPKE